MNQHVWQQQRQVRQFMASHQEELRHLGRHLHDELGQLLAALCMRLHLAHDRAPPDLQSHLDECLAIARLAIGQVRELSFELSPAILADSPFPDVVRGYLDRRCRAASLAVKLTVSSAWQPLPPEIEATCLRVIQETVGNVIRHAAAGCVQVKLRQDPDAVDVTIRDDGRGLDLQPQECCGERPQGRGLSTVRQQVEILGGTWMLEASPGRGTTVRVRLPVQDGSEE